MTRGIFFPWSRCLQARSYASGEVCGKLPRTTGCQPVLPRNGDAAQ
jgi:hypothetical protein